MPPQIWVDADAAPRPCKAVLLRIAQRGRARVVLVANQWLHLDRPLQLLQVPGGADVADDAIAARCGPGDLVITADIPLAARAVAAGAQVITPYGRDLDADNVREALSLRDFHDELREVGVSTGGPPPYDERTKQRFANAVDRWLTAQG